jgi:hypothetical protein
LVSISRGEELAKGAVLAGTAPDASLLPVLRGGLDVRPFRCRFASVYLRREQVTKPLERYHAPKLLVVKSTGLLAAALDAQDFVALQTLYLLHAKTAQWSLAYLLALLNSRLLRSYLWLHHTAYKLVQPQIEQEALARLPIPLAQSAQQQELASLAEQLQQCYRKQDELALRLASACANEAAWIQLEQSIYDLAARLDASIATLCSLTAAEQALLERLPAPK